MHCICFYKSTQYEQHITGNSHNQHKTRATDEESKHFTEFLFSFA